MSGGGHEKMDWAGEAGDKFAKWNKFDSEGQDTMYLDIYGVKQSDVLKKVFEAMKAEGLKPEKAKVLDIGCNAGGVMENVQKVGGFLPSNMHGVDLSPKAIAINSEKHPEYNLKVVKGIEYDVPKVDFVYHTGVLCQIEESEYARFYANVKAAGAKFYMFMEGINTRGYEPIPNSAAGHSHSHGHGHDGNHDKKDGILSAPMDEGYHFTDDHEKVAERHFPKAKKIFSQRLDHTESAKPWFEPMHMDYGKCNVYVIKED